MPAIDFAQVFIAFVVLLFSLTVHESAHAWTADRLGDPTGRLLGRVSLNPLVHIDPIGTVVMPLLMIFLSPGIGRFLVGWAKPVPVNPSNLRNPRVDDILISLAGPWMNLLLAVVFMGLARVGLMVGSESIAVLLAQTARLSLMLCFFNLIPIPPLDGSHVVRSLIGMSYETYYQFARYGFIAVIIVIQLPFVTGPLRYVTDISWRIIGSWFGLSV